MSKSTFLSPHLSEQSYEQSARRVYVFKVEKGANKHTIARAVEAQFDVKVSAVNVSNISGKHKRIVSASGKRSRNAEGQQNDIRKAYVTLREGNSLPFFNAVEEAAEKEQANQEKVTEALTKQAEKDAKPARRGLRKVKKEEDK